MARMTRSSTLTAATAATAGTAPHRRRRGRPAQGADLVDHVQASPVARDRFKVIVQTLSGDLPVKQACRILGIGRSMFNKLRGQFLERSAGLLEPRGPGRKRRVPAEVQAELQRLREENASLKLELRAQQVREELAVVMPHLLRPRPGPTPGRTARGKKTRG